jgi:heme/copper-type cytochrome/quinol oxidase subunit 2
LLLKIMFWIGAIFLVLSIALSGIGVSGDRMRANYYNERDVDPEREERRSRLKWTLIFFLISVIFIAPTFIVYLVNK